MKKDVLVLDLDGTLIRNDLSYELLILCFRLQPFLLIRVFFQFLSSRSKAKRLLAEHLGDHINVANLPYNDAVLQLIERYREDGHHIALVSGSDEILVERVARHLALDSFKGSVSGVNLTSKNKAEYLLNTYGDEFVYAGNSKADFAVWRAAKRGYAVNAPSGAYSLKRDDGKAVSLKKLEERSSQIPSLVKAMRLHQWTKNLLLFLVPALFILELDGTDLLKLFLAFGCFSLLASATYILNDLFDMSADRAHHSKYRRPLASGKLGVPLAIMSIIILLPTCLAVAFLIEYTFGVALLLYAVLTIVYSLWLKRIIVLDVFILASLFTLRVIAGANVVGYAPSGWLLIFVGLFFLSLALAKRYVEVSRTHNDGKISGRGYEAVDKVPLMIAGINIGFLSVLALLIYGILSPSFAFHWAYSVLMGSAILCAWILRLWLIAGRDKLNDDPVIFAVTDRISVFMLGVIASIFALDITSPAWIHLF